MLTRKDLEAMEIDEKKISAIIQGHADSIEALKKERDAFKEKAEKYDTLLTEHEQLKNELTSAKESADKFTALKQEFENYKSEIQKKAAQTAKASAYQKLLASIGIPEKRISPILKVTDLNAIEINSDGSLRNAETLTEQAKSDWADFIMTESVQGAEIAAPNANTGGATFEKMSLAEKMTYANQNPQSAEVRAWLGKS